jgi:hypothetical protein
MSGPYPFSAYSKKGPWKRSSHFLTFGDVIVLHFLNMCISEFGKYKINAATNCILYVIYLRGPGNRAYRVEIYIHLLDLNI